MKTNIFLQARLNSSRLPGKCLLPLSGITVLEHCMNALNLVKANSRVLLTSKDSEKHFRKIVLEKGWQIFIGSAQDVLDRFARAARKFPSTFVIRATADNPLVSPELANEALQMAINSRADYARFEGLPTGSGVEIIRSSALFKAANEATEQYDREHVTPYLYRDHEKNHFLLKIKTAPPIYHAPHIRITLDYPKDYLYLQRIFQEIYQNHPVGLDKLIMHIRKRKKNAS